MSSKAYPLVKIVLFFLLGLFIADHCSYSIKSLLPYFIFISCSTLIGIYSLVQKSIYKSWLSILLYFSTGVIGIIHYSIHLPHFQSCHYLNKTDTEYLGQIQWQKHKSGYQQLHINLDSSRSINSKFLPTCGVIQCMIKDSIDLNLKKGDRISFSAKLKDINTLKNPHAFDYQGYLNNKNIYKQCFINPCDLIILHRNNVSDFEQLAQNCKSKMVYVIEKYIKNKFNLAIVNAMVLGDKHDLDPAIKKAFSETGTMHVLAVSGLHVGIVAGIVLLCLSWIKKSTGMAMAIKYLLTLFIIWLFTGITGFGPSAVRSAGMFSILIVGKIAEKQTKIFNLIGGTALIMLIINPLYIHDIGFQFSFLALISILFFYPIIYPFFTSRFYFLNKITSLISVSIAAQILILPLSIYYFKQTSLIFWLTGIIAIPAAFVTLSLSFVLMALELFQLEILNALLISKILNGTLTCFNHSIIWFQKTKYAYVDDLWLSMSSLITCYIILLLFMLFFLRKRIAYLIPVLITLSALVINIKVSKYNYQNSSEVYIYDTYGFNLIDIFHNGKLYTIQSLGTDSIDIEKVAKNNRLAHTYIQHINLDNHKYFNDLSVSYSNGFFIVKDKVFAFSEKIEDSEYDSSKIDFLLLNNLSHMDSYLKDNSFNKIVSMPSLKNKWFLTENAFYEKQHHIIKRDGFLKINL